MAGTIFGVPLTPLIPTLEVGMNMVPYSHRFTCNYRVTTYPMMGKSSCR